MTVSKWTRNCVKMVYNSWLQVKTRDRAEGNYRIV